MLHRRILIGLIGSNIMKSLSPSLHEDAFTDHGLQGHYHLMDAERLHGRRLEQLFASAIQVGFSGFNVTFPFKQAVLPLLDDVSADARQIGAVNTVTISEGGRAIGYNTDRSGFRRSVTDSLGKDAVRGQKVVLVGAGGAGRAVAFALMDLGVSHLSVHDIDVQCATATVADLALHFGTSRCAYGSDVEASISDAIGVVNATPIGMLGMPGNPVPVAALRSDQFVADVIYTPMETELILGARAKGCRVLTGGGMCVHQAADAFRLFTGLEPDIERMHRTFIRALAARDAVLKSAA